MTNTNGTVNMNETVNMNNTAQDQAADDHSIRLAKAKKGILISLISLASFIVSMIFATGTSDAAANVCIILMLVTIITAIASYIIGGGFSMCIGLALELGKIGWIVAPFPIDFATGIGCSLIAILAFLFMPIIFVGINYRNIKKEVA